MICFKCSNEEFELQEANVRQDFRGESFEVKARVSVCTSCGWQALGVGQADALRKQTVEEYRRKHGLLTSTEVILRRTMRGMSQQAFAKFIGAGVASVKRWERGFVQEPIYDKQIRQKCDNNTFLYSLSDSVVLGIDGLVVVQGKISVTTHEITVIPYYSIPQIGILSNVSRLTSRLTCDANLAASSKEWRKKHAKTSDTEFLSCP